jgi:RNA polymerase sigma factor (sigma-70 family)
MTHRAGQDVPKEPFRVPAPRRDLHLVIFARRPWYAAAANVLFDPIADRARIRVAGDDAELDRALAEDPPDAVAVLCPTQSQRHVDRLRDLLVRHPDLRILAVSAEPDSVIARRVRAAGARGHISLESGVDETLAAVRAVADGQDYFAEADVVAQSPAVEARPQPADLDQRLRKLTRRERQVMDLLGQGYSNREIAQSLGLREGTIRIYVHRVIRQLGLRNRVDVALCASRMAS